MAVRTCKMIVCLSGSDPGLEPRADGSPQLQASRLTTGRKPLAVAAAAAKLGGASRFIGKPASGVSDSELRSLLAGAGVEAALIAADGAADLAGAAADRELAEAGLQAGWLDDAAVCHFGSDSLVSERCRRATLEAARRIKSAGGLISYDPSLSPDLWPNEAEMRREALAPVELADVLQVSERDALLLTGLEPAEAVQELLGMGVKAVVVTLGGDGCCVITRSAMTAVSAIRVKIVDASGAEDSFTGAMLYMLVKQGITAETVEAALTDEHMAGYIFSVATKAAAIASTRRGDIPALPEMAEIEAI